MSGRAGLTVFRRRCGRQRWRAGRRGRSRRHRGRTWQGSSRRRRDTRGARRREAEPAATPRLIGGGVDGLPEDLADLVALACFAKGCLTTYALTSRGAGASARRRGHAMAAAAQALYPMAWGDGHPHPLAPGPPSEAIYVTDRSGSARRPGPCLMRSWPYSEARSERARCLVARLRGRRRLVAPWN